MSTAGQAIGGLVGGVVGAFVGGPTGAIYGAQIGMMAGGYLDPPKIKGNHPRSDLSVQSATYGAPLGSGYGNYATYGNVFWVEGNSLRQIDGEDGGGKGGPSKPTPDEVYGTFAIGFGEGEIAAFGRIWCNGNLVYDPTSGTIGAQMANGDIAGSMTLYLGSATQLPDDRIQADYGVAYCPAWRGMHYIVFKDWPMADYGNTLMGMQVKAEIINSADVTQYARLIYEDALLADVNTYPGAGATQYGYFNPQFIDGLFRCDIASQANGYAYSFGVSLEAVLIDQQVGSYTTGVLGYIGTITAGVVEFVGGTTGTFKVAGVDFKTKTSDANNTCHGMAVGADGRLYVLEVVAGVGLIKIYDGSTLALISSGANGSIGWGASNVALPAIPGTPATFCVEPDGVHVWMAAQAFGDSYFKLCVLSPSGDLSDVHSFNSTTEGHLGPYALSASVTALNGICCGINNHGGFFVYTRNAIIAPVSVELADIVSDRCLRSGLLTAADIDTTLIDQLVRGYRVPEAMSIRSSLEPLQGAWPFDTIPSGYKLKFVPRGGASVITIDSSELGAAGDGGTPGVRLTQSREMASQLPRKVQITYIDTNREYDKGTGPGAERLNTDAVNVQALDMPIVLNAGEAAGIEETLLYLYWLERVDVAFILPPTYAALEVADIITIVDGAATYLLRLPEINYLADGRLECKAKYNNPAIYSPTAVGQEGQSTGQVLSYAGPTIMRLLDMPCVDSTTMNVPGMLSVACGSYTGWTGGTIYESDDSGQSWTGVQGFSAPGSIFGYANNALAAGATHIIDTANSINVRIYSGALSSVTELAMFNGSNHFAIGLNGRWEIIAARTATAESDGTYTLRNLMRGRFGTEQYIGTHAVFDQVVLLDPAAVRFIGMDVAAINQARLWRGVTRGQLIDSAASESVTYTGVNLECLSPIQIRGAKNAASDWSIEWTRRTRTPVEPFSGIAAPLGETGEAYEIEIWDSTFATLKRTITGLSSASATYTNAQQVTDFGAVQKLIYVKVYQLSATVGRGYAGQAVCGNLALQNVKSLIHFDDTPATYGRVLGLHCNGTNGSTTFTDVIGKTVTAVGNAQISTTWYPSIYGKTSSGYLDGAGDYLIVAHSGDFNFGSGDFTIRSRNLFYATGILQVLIDARGSLNDFACAYALFLTAANKIVFYADSTSADNNGMSWELTLTSTTTISSSTEYDIEVSRSGNVFRLFINGYEEASTTLSLTIGDAASSVKIGAGVNGTGTTGYFANMYFSEVEIFKGFAVHTANFTPPSIPFSDSGQSILDQAQNTITVAGTAVTVAAADSFNVYCLQANQASGYVSTPIIPLTELYWTIDCWIKPDALPGYGYTSGVFQYGTGSSGADGLCVALYNTGQIVCIFEHGVEINAGTVAPGERVHVFVQRSGSNIYIGSGGTVGGSRAVSLTNFDGNKAFRVGYASTLYLDPKAIKIDEFRVFEGEAKYPLSGAYVVPTTPFPDI